MIFPSRLISSKLRLLLAFTLLFCTNKALAITYDVMFDSTLGTCEAPPGGGPISACSVTFGDTTFDLPSDGAAAPEYKPLFNTLNGLYDIEFRGTTQTTAHVFNSIASATCPLGDCTLFLYDTAGGTGLPEYLVLKASTLENLNLGYYSISPAAVPLPATLPLLAVALGMGYGLRRRLMRKVKK